VYANFDVPINGFQMEVVVGDGLIITGLSLQSHWSGTLCSCIWHPSLCVFIMLARQENDKHNPAIIDLLLFFSLGTIVTAILLHILLPFVLGWWNCWTWPTYLFPMEGDKLITGSKKANLAATSRTLVAASGSNVELFRYTVEVWAPE